MLDLNNEFLNANGQNSVAAKNPFPVTFHNFLRQYGSSGAFVNRSILSAHDLIENGKSPYLAWAETLGYTRVDLPKLLNMDEKACDYLVNHPRQSPPTRNVQYFCDKTGVHPGYLMPAHLQDHPIHYPVLRAVAHIYKDTSFSTHERGIAKNCLEQTYKMFESFQQENPRISRYLLKAMAAARTHYFNRKSANPASYIELGLDLFEERQHQVIQHSMRSIEQETDAIKPEVVDRLISDAGRLIYGAEKASRIINATLHMVKYHEKTEKDLHWVLLEDGVWNKQSATDASQNDYVWSGHLSSDFEANARLNEYEPAALLKHFERCILTKVAFDLNKERNKNIFEGYDRGLEKLQAWRNSDNANLRHIPQFANYVLAARTLRKPIGDLALAPERKEEPVKNERHAYHYSVK